MKLSDSECGGMWFRCLFVELFCFKMIWSEFSQVEKMAAEPLETKFNFSCLVLKASGDFVQCGLSGWQSLER